MWVQWLNRKRAGRSPVWRVNISDTRSVKTWTQAKRQPLRIAYNQQPNVKYGCQRVLQSLVPADKEMQQREQRRQDQNGHGPIDHRHERLVVPVQHLVQDFLFPPNVVPNNVEEYVDHPERL